MRVARSTVVLCVLVMAGCSITQVEPPATTIVRIELDETIDSSSAGLDRQRFEVTSLGIAFALPTNFASFDDESYDFFARSAAPRLLFTIQSDDSEVTDYSARPGETVTPVMLDGVDAVLIVDAALEGLPSGISANELLVSNGDQSFSVIMSGEADSLDEMWAVFVSSVVLA